MMFVFLVLSHPDWDAYISTGDWYELGIAPLYFLSSFFLNVYLLYVGLQCCTESGFHIDRGLLHGTESSALSEVH